MVEFPRAASRRPFFGLGGYSYAVAALNFGDTTYAVPVAIAAPALVAAALGYVMFYGRISDVYIGAITLTLTLILFNFVNSTAGDQWRIGAAPLGGFNGIPSTPPLNLPGDPGTPLPPEAIFAIAVASLLLCYIVAKPHSGCHSRARGIDHAAWGAAEPRRSVRPLPRRKRGDMTALLATEHLTMRFGGVVAVDDVSLSVAAGELRCLIGPNGAGKSTLFKCLTGQIKPSVGRVLWRGRDITGLDSFEIARLGIGIKTQVPSLFDGSTVRENLLFGLRAKSGGDDVLAQILDEFPELKRLLDRPGGALSGGEQQLLALARALCGQPRLLLLDEPTEGIQPSIVAAMIERLYDLRVRYELSILLVEQNLDFIRGLADRALLIQRGEIKREISRAALADHTLVEEFIGAV